MESQCEAEALTALVFLAYSISISFYLRKMPSYHLNGTENDILKFIFDHTKKAFFPFCVY